MSQSSDSGLDTWKIVAAVSVALATTAGGAAFATYIWMGDHSPPPEPDNTETAEPAPTPTEDDEPDSRKVAPSEAKPPGVYDLPDHGGRLVGEQDGDRFGLPRIHADYEVDIRGDLATVIVEQSFENPLDRTIETTYEFPLYSDAAVYSMVLEIGDRRIVGDVKRKEEARELYEEAKQAGKKAALLEQDRPNLFTQRVANIEPGQRVEITLRYTHPIPKSHGEYHLTVPLAVPERYTPDDMSDNKLVEGAGPDDPGAEPGGLEDESESKSESASDDNRDQSGVGTVDVSVRLDGGMPITDVSSLSHHIRVDRLAETDRRVELLPKSGAVHRHFRLSYKLAGDEPRLGLHAYRQKGEAAGYFDLLIEPPADVTREAIPKREMVYVLDRSASMSRRARFDEAEQVLVEALEDLRPTDRFRILAFNKKVVPFRDTAIEATDEHIRAAERWIRQLGPEGGTNMASAVRYALEPERPDDFKRMVVFVTDVKVSNEFEIIQLVRKFIDQARILTIGVGPDINTYLLDELARAGRGFSRQMRLDGDLSEFVDETIHRFQRPVFTDISVDWGELKPSDVTPTPIPDVFSGKSLRLHGKYPEPGEYDIEVTGDLDGRTRTLEKTVQLADAANDGRAVQLAWARMRVDDYMHELNTPARLRADGLDDEQIRQNIIQLGLDYSLTTQWTSFVAVDEKGELIDRSEQSRAPDRRRGTGAALKKRQARSMGNLNVGRGAGGMGLRGSGSGGSSSSKSFDPPDAKALFKQKDDLGSTKRQDRDSVTGHVHDSSSSDPETNLEVTMVDSPPSKTKAEQVVASQKPLLQTCYTNELVDNSDLKGEATLRIEVSGNGTVDQVNTTSASITDAVTDCLAQYARIMSFPNQPDDQVGVFKLHLEFSPDG